MKRIAWLAVLAMATSACDSGSSDEDPTPTSDASEGAGGEGGVGGDGGNGGEGGDGGVGGDAPSPDAGVEPDAAPPPVGCSGQSFAAMTEFGTIEAYGHRYYAVDGNQNPFSVMTIELKGNEGGAAEPGTYEIDGPNIATCKNCVYILKQCDPISGRCGQVFVANQGTIEVSRIDDGGGRFVATLHNAEFIEVTVNQQPLSTTPKADGATFCEDGYGFDVEVKPPPARIGEEVRDFPLQNCETGEFIDMYSLGRFTDALWIVGSAGWCPACRQFLPQVIDISNRYQASKLRTVIVVGEDANYGPPSLEFCRQYARNYDRSAARFYIDHDGQRSFAQTFASLNPYTGPGGEFGLPWNALIKGGEYTYFYADRAGVGDLNMALNALLGGGE